MAENLDKAEEGDFYKELWNRAPIAYHVLNKDGIIVQVNETEAKMLGYQRKEMLGKPIFIFILPEQREEAKKRFKLKLTGQYLAKEENRIYQKKDKTKVYVSISDVLRKDQKGRIVGIWTTMADITERKLMEKKLIESYRYLGVINRRIPILLDLRRNPEMKKNKAAAKFILSSAQNISGANAGLIYKIIKRKKLELICAQGFDVKGKQKIKDVSQKYSDFLFQFALKKERNAEMWDDERIAKCEIWKEKKVGTLMIMPLRGRRHLKGFMLLGFPAKKVMTSQELDFYDIFSFHATMALSDVGIFD